MHGKWKIPTIALIALLLAGCTMVVDPSLQAGTTSPQIEPQAGAWGTWILDSSDELRPSSPPDSAAPLRRLPS